MAYMLNADTTATKTVVYDSGSQYRTSYTVATEGSPTFPTAMTILPTQPVSVAASAAGGSAVSGLATLFSGGTASSLTSGENPAGPEGAPMTAPPMNWPFLIGAAIVIYLVLR